MCWYIWRNPADNQDPLVHVSYAASWGIGHDGTHQGPVNSPTKDAYSSMDVTVVPVFKYQQNALYDEAGNETGVDTTDLREKNLWIYERAESRMSEGHSHSHGNYTLYTEQNPFTGPTLTSSASTAFMPDISLALVKS